MKTRDPMALLALLVAIGFALWLFPDADVPGSGNAETELVVKTSLDSGPGSLRDAIFRALRYDGHATIVIDVQTVMLATSLPPLASGPGISLRAKPGNGLIDASALSAGPVLDLRLGDSELRGIAIRSAPGAAIRIAGAGNVLVEGVALIDGDVGIDAESGYRLTVLGGELDGNRIGIELLGDGAALISKGTVFRNHSEASVWAVRADLPGAGATVELEGARIDGGRYGVVLGNVAARLRSNRVTGFKADGVLSFGGVLDVTDNRIAGGGVGIRAVGVTSGSIVRNEIADNAAIGVLLQAARAARVEDNKLYRNGYGITTVMSQNAAAVELRNNLLVAQRVDAIVVIGDSPLLTDNHARDNKHAGIHVMNLVQPGSYLESSPRLVGNDLRDNGSDEPVHDDYVLRVAMTEGEP